MLGKGLESLIPPQKGSAPQDEPQSSVAPTNPPASDLNSQPSGHLPDPAIVDDPSRGLPAQPSGLITPPVISMKISQPSPSTQNQQSAPAKPFPNQPSQPQRKEPQVNQSVFNIEVDKIRPNPSQPRREFNQDAIRDLAHSIREFGLLQPLVVTKVGKETPDGIDVEYELIAGERRLLASKLLGLRIVPAIIRNVGLEREKLELAVIENIQRENLNPIETARAFQRLQEEFRLTQREIAAKLGKSREMVANSVRLLDLPAYIQEALQKGDISESHGRLLLSVDDPAAQKKLFDEITTFHLTTRDLKERVERMRKPAEDDELPLEVKALRESLSASLGAPVEIKKNANNGKISITFYSEEELENILRRLGKEEG